VWMIDPKDFDPSKGRSPRKSRKPAKGKFFRFRVLQGVVV
jgi:hypothetical protein